MQAARAAAAHRPPVVQAEDYAYFANQEEAGKIGGRDDFEKAFALARSLPASRTQIKGQVERDAVDGLLMAGDFEAAEAMAGAADAGQREILNRLIPAELAAGRLGRARRLWARLEPGASGFAYAAARALLAAPETAAYKAALRDKGLAAAGDSHQLVHTEVSEEFLEATLKAEPRLKAEVGEAALRMANALPLISGRGLEIQALHARLKKLVGKAAPEKLKQLEHTAVAPALGPRPQRPAHKPVPRPASPPPARAKVVRPGDSFVGAVLSALSGNTGTPAFPEGTAQTALKMLTPKIAAENPVAVAQLAAACFEWNWLKREQRPLRLALDEAVRRANAVKPGDRIALGSSPALIVFGIVAEIDFPAAAARALALQPGPIRPLVLAHVARMARAAARWQPGHTITLLH